MNRTLLALPPVALVVVLVSPWSSPRPATAADLPAKPAGKLEYNRDIRPILAENCFACHGPDSAARKAGLRIDRRDAAIEAGAIVPGEPESSELIARINAEDRDELMPPPA